MKNILLCLVLMCPYILEARERPFICVNDTIEDPTHVYVRDFSFKNNDMAHICYRKDGQNIQLLYGLKRGAVFNLGDTRLNTTRSFQSGYYQFYISNLDSNKETGFLGFSQDSNDSHFEHFWQPGEKHYVYHPIFFSRNKAHFLIETSYLFRPGRGLEFVGLKLHEHASQFEDHYQWNYLSSLKYELKRVSGWEFFIVDVPKRRLCQGSFPCTVEVVGASSTHNVFIPTVIDRATADDLTKNSSLIIKIE